MVAIIIPSAVITGSYQHSIEIEPCAVFLPTALPTPNTPYPCADWGGTYDSDLRQQMINALHELDSLIDQYGFDTKRQYLYGESMGGEGVYRLLMDFPTRFAGAIDAAGYTLNKGAAQMAKTPLWILIGSADEMSPEEQQYTTLSIQTSAMYRESNRLVSNRGCWSGYLL